MAFAYERGWRDSFQRAGFPGPDESSPSRAPNSSHTRAEKCSWTPRAAVASSPADSPRAASTDALSRWIFRRHAPPGAPVRRRRKPSRGGRDPRRPRVRPRGHRATSFPRGSVAGVHAGAAIHCWPEPRSAVAEIARVLEPGAAFCGTTFLTPKIPFADDATQQAVDAAVREVSDALAGRVGSAGVQAVEQTRSRGALRRVRVGGFRVRRPRRVHLLRRRNQSRSRGRMRERARRDACRVGGTCSGRAMRWVGDVRRSRARRSRAFDDSIFFISPVSRRVSAGVYTSSPNSASMRRTHEPTDPPRPFFARVSEPLPRVCEGC